MFTFVDTKEQRNNLINRKFRLGIRLFQPKILELSKFKLMGFGDNTSVDFYAGMWLYPDKGVILVYLRNKQSESRITSNFLNTLSVINRIVKDK